MELPHVPVPAQAVRPPVLGVREAELGEGGVDFAREMIGQRAVLELDEVAAPVFVGGLRGDALGDLAVVERAVGETDRDDLGGVGVEVDLVLVVLEVGEEDDPDVVVE